MGVLIKDMEMPKNCFECKLRDGMGKDCGKAIFHCIPLEKWVAPNPLEKADDCPLIEDSFTDIAYIPSVTTVWKNGEAPTYVQLKKGKWLKKHDKISYWHECSECGEKAKTNSHFNIILSNYCPNCGADMRGKADA